MDMSFGKVQESLVSYMTNKQDYIAREVKQTNEKKRNECRQGKLNKVGSSERVVFMEIVVKS
jgi:hypothetical protein